MAPEDPNDSDESDESDERADPTFGLRAGLSAFADLLRTLDAEGERRSSGRIEGDRANIDYDVNIGTGPGDRRGRPRSRSGSRSRRRKRRARDEDYLVTTRETDDDGVVVIADLPGVDSEDLTVGFEQGDETLVVAVNDEVVERVSLPWPARAERSTFRNGMLEIDLKEEE